MTNTQSKLIGYGLLSALSVILWVPLIELMNTNIPSGGIGDALGSFFWIIYPIAVLWLIIQTLLTALYG